jgi:hypothetical protein
MSLADVCVAVSCVVGAAAVVGDGRVSRSGDTVVERTGTQTVVGTGVDGASVACGNGLITFGSRVGAGGAGNDVA